MNICNWVNIEQFLIKRIEENVLSPEFDINSSNEDGFTLMHLACQKGMTEVCSALIQHGVRIDSLNSSGRTPLMLASYSGANQIVQTLVKHNAKVHWHDYYGFDAVSLSVYSGNDELFQYLFDLTECNITGYCKNCISPLAVSASTGQYKMTKYIISRRPEYLNHPVKNSGMSPLMLAICSRQLKTVELLHEGGASLDSLSEGSVTALAYGRTLSVSVLRLPPVPRFTLNDGLNIPLAKHRSLTPNICISPVRKVRSPKRCLDWIKRSVNRRSKSVDYKKVVKGTVDKEDENILKCILDTANLQQYWPFFKQQQISFKTFLTLDIEDLTAIGITKLSAKIKLLNLIDHYKKIFYL